jgi:hypothetical protein
VESLEARNTLLTSTSLHPSTLRYIFSPSNSHHSQKSKYAVKPRSIDFVLVKKEAGPYWDRLLKEAGKQRWLKVDWNKWKDEDEADEEDNFDVGGMNNFDMGAMGGMGGMGGFPGMGGMGGFPGMGGMPGMEGMEGMNFDDQEDSDEEGKNDISGNFLIFRNSRPRR